MFNSFNGLELKALDYLFPEDVAEKVENQNSMYKLKQG